MTDLTALQEQVKNVARAREQARKVAEEREAAYRIWAEANQTLLNAADDARAYQAEQETLLRELTLEVYEETQNKKPAPGVAIREITKLDYDPKEALTWAMHHKIALALDKKSFEGFARATPLEFVTVTTEAQATISQDLTEVLE